MNTYDQEAPTLVILIRFKGVLFSDVDRVA